MGIKPNMDWTTGEPIPMMTNVHIGGIGVVQHGEENT